MDKWQREFIRKNLPALMRDTRCDDELLAYLLAYGIFGDGDMANLNSKANELSKKMEFYRTVQTKTGSYKILIDALRDTCQAGVASLLESGYEGKESPLSSPGPPSGARGPPLTPTIYVPIPQPQKFDLPVPTINIRPATPIQEIEMDQGISMRSISEVDSGSSSTNGIENTTDEIDFLENIQPLAVSVRKPAQPMEFRDDSYKLRQDFKGHALVLNITEFINSDRNREGAKHDTKYMADLWSELGYDVTTHEGFFTSETIMDILTEFKAKFQTRSPMGEPQSCVVFIGSHGSFSKIESSDHHPIDLFQDLIFTFDAKSSPSLIGKPKIFIVQSCQRFQTDDIRTPNRSEADAMLMNPIDDAIVCFSTVPGYVANRDVYLGTWYAYCLAKVFMDHAHQLDLLKLLKKVQETMRKINADAPQGQLPTSLDLGIKTLYFNMYP